MKKIKKLFALAVASVLLALGGQALAQSAADENADIQIVMCGDSIMRTYEPSESDECGWGQVLQLFFDKGVYVNNTLSNGGRSSKSFYYEKERWENVRKILEERKSLGKQTYVFINFGHNDQKYSGHTADYMNFATYAKKNPAGWAEKTYKKEKNVIDSYDPLTKSDNGTYEDFLQKYITETKELGGIPVIFSPFVRCDLSEGKVTDKGAHNLTSAYKDESEPRGNYQAAAREIAEKNGVAFVDLTELTRAYVNSAAAAGKTKFVYIPTDNTHVRTLGAMKICEMAVSELKKQKILAKHIVTPKPRVFVDAKAIDFGRIYPGNSVIKSFKISAFNANGGSVSLKAPKSYGLSLDEKGPFSPSLKIATKKGFFGVDVFVKFEPEDVGDYNFDLAVSHSSTVPDFGTSPAGKIEKKNLLVSLTGAGKAKVAGGQDFTVTYPMIDEKKKAVYTASVDPEGVVSPALATVSKGLVASTSKNDYVESKYRTRFASALPAGWSGEMNKDMFVQFALPAGKNSVIVNQISLELASSGTGNMRWDVYYSTNEDFSSPVPIVQGGSGTVLDKDGATKSNCNDVLTTVKSEGDMGLNLAGKTLYVRVYPYMKTADANGAGRLLMVGNVKIEGIVQ